MKNNVKNTKIVITFIALTAATLHMYDPDLFVPDAITAGLLLLAITPWLTPIFESIELPGVGKLDLRMEQVEDNQVHLKQEVDALRFLVMGFVTDWEADHLRKLSSKAPFHYQRGMDKGDRFIQEVIRLRDFRLIKKRFDYSIWDIPQSGDLKELFELTERGKQYLSIRNEAMKEEFQNDL